MKYNTLKLMGNTGGSTESSVSTSSDISKRKGDKQQNFIHSLVNLQPEKAKTKIIPSERAKMW